MDPPSALSKHIERMSIVELLQSLVRIPSVTGEEEAAQLHVAQILRDLGGDVDVWRPDARELQGLPGFPGARILTSRPNVVGVFRGSGAGPMLVLNGHMDTVTAGHADRWTYPPFSGEVADGKVYGRGACDMKGGLVAILAALRAIREAGLRFRGSVSVQSVIGEEDGGFRTFAALARGHRGDAVIVCEPTQLAVVPAHAGVTLFRITVPGRAAHGAVRLEGVSAFHSFLPIHDALMRLEKQRNETLRHGLYEGIGLPWPISIGIVQAGNWPAIVPEFLTAEGRIGVAVGERIEDVRRQFEEAVRNAAAADPWLSTHPPSVEWIGGVWEPAVTSRDHLLVQTLSKAVRQVTGQSASVRGVSYGSDMRLFTNNYGIPGVLFGPGDIRLAHFTDEYVPIAEVEQAALALAMTTLEFCGMV